MHDGDLSIRLKSRRKKQLNRCIFKSLSSRRERDPLSVGRETGMSIGPLANASDVVGLFRSAECDKSQNLRRAYS
jgi:hypothetical protein